ncbi:cytochrome P450 [Aspergillus egyptiacus]|nr:cytochrome P450 [Aspergillus egyptiacus]
MSLITLSLTLAACLITLPYLWSTWSHTRKARRWGCAPIPRYPSDILGITTLREILQADKDGTIPNLLQRRVETVSAREGRPVSTFSIRQMGRESIFTCDPANVQAMLATKFKDFELGPARRHTLYSMLGEGTFTSDGEAWMRSRALLRPQFSREQVSDLELEERHVQQAMLAMPVDPTTGWSSEIDLQAIFYRLTIDSATEFLVGESSNSQAEALRNGGSLPADHFSYHFDRGQWYVAQRARFERLHWLVDNKESRHVIRQVHAYVDRFVAAALQTAAAAEGKPKAKANPSNYVFLEALVNTTKENPSPSPIELRSQLLNILLAGRDTTASLLSWSALMLARHPPIFTKLRSTILASFGPYTTKNKSITFSSLKSCRYLQHFLSEVLRLYPAVPVNRRVAKQDTTLPRGGGPDGSAPVYLRAGTNVIYSPFVTQRRGEFFGGDAEVFDPDRWDRTGPSRPKARDRASGGTGWEYLPFNGGPRVCLGQQFALTEAAYVLVRLLQRFDAMEEVSPELGSGEEGRGIKYGLTLTMAPGESVVVRLREAREGE